MMPSDTYRSYGRGRARRLRLHCYSAAHPVHVVISTFERRDLFSERALAEVVFTLLARETPLAACLMPDHLHWVLSSGERWSERVHSFKSRTTRAAWATGHQGRLWQRSFYDHVVRVEEDLRSTIGYVLDNPVTAGLVAVAEEWPYRLAPASVLG